MKKYTRVERVRGAWMGNLRGMLARVPKGTTRVVCTVDDLAAMDFPSSSFNHSTWWNHASNKGVWESLRWDDEGTGKNGWWENGSMSFRKKRGFQPIVDVTVQCSDLL